MCTAVSYAADKIAFEITLDRDQVSVGGTAQLNLTFHGTQNVSAPRVPDIEGFKINYLGPATRMSIVNGRIAMSITHMYRLFATNTGKFQIGPFEMDIEGDTVRSNALVLEVLSGAVPARQQPPAGVPAPPLPGEPGSAVQDLGDRAFVVLSLDKQTLYVNEVLNLTLKVYVRSLSMRDIQYPEFSHEGFSISEFGKPDQKPEVQHGKTYEVLEFRMPIFPVRAGDLTLGPAVIKANAIVPRTERVRHSIFDNVTDEDIFQDFFDRYQTFPVELKSSPLTVKVLPLPEEGKPANFEGAVGNYTMMAQALPAKIKLGDPITLKMTVSGAGNLNTVNAPAISVSEDDFKVYEPQVTKQDQSAKVFEQVIIPKKPGAGSVPKIVFNYFDPALKSYKAVESGPFPIDVLKPEKEEQVKVVEMPKKGVIPGSEEVLGRDIIYIKNSPG
ncbi:MAG: BatD family protein, partial [Candidatus Omnitrophica bacterium]|nr:BatD family protein [Candidatus Omnitrophota bacterium]